MIYILIAIWVIGAVALFILSKKGLIMAGTSKREVITRICYVSKNHGITHSIKKWEDDIQDKELNAGLSELLKDYEWIRYEVMETWYDHKGRRVVYHERTFHNDKYYLKHDEMI